MSGEILSYNISGRGVGHFVQGGGCPGGILSGGFVQGDYVLDS